MILRGVYSSGGKGVYSSDGGGYIVGRGVYNSAAGRRPKIFGVFLINQSIFIRISQSRTLNLKKIACGAR